MRKPYAIGAALVIGVCVLLVLSRAYAPVRSRDKQATTSTKSSEALPPHQGVAIVTPSLTPIPAIPSPTLAPGMVTLHGRRDEVLAALLKTLEQESPQEGVRKLDQVHEYFLPLPAAWTAMGGGPIGLARTLELSDDFLVEGVLNNRRFLKILDELSKMPKDEAGKLVSSELDKTLAAYKVEEDARIARCTQYAALGQMHGLGARMGNAPDGSPTFEGERLKLMALALTAGTLQLPEARASILKLADVAVAQQQNIQNPNFLTEFYRVCIAHYDSIYSSRVLATALAGTSPSGLSAAMADPVQSGQWKVITLPMYNAQITAFDTPTRSLQTFFGVDYTKGRQTIFVHESLSDADFNALLAKNK